MRPRYIIDLDQLALVDGLHLHAFCEGYDDYLREFHSA